VQDSAGLRRRRLYRPTNAGITALKEWLARPIQPGDVQRGASELMLRFGFMEHALGTDACMSFLRDFGAALRPYPAGLESFFASNAANMPLSARLALECGIRGYQTLEEWTEYALRAYRKSEATQEKRNLIPSKGGRK